MVEIKRNNKSRLLERIENTGPLKSFLVCLKFIDIVCVIELLFLSQLNHLKYSFHNYITCFQLAFSDCTFEADTSPVFGLSLINV